MYHIYASSDDLAYRQNKPMHISHTRSQKSFVLMKVPAVLLSDYLRVVFTKNYKLIKLQFLSFDQMIVNSSEIFPRSSIKESKQLTGNFECSF